MIQKLNQQSDIIIEQLENLDITQNRNEKYIYAFLGGGEYFGEEEIMIGQNERLLSAQCTSVLAKVYAISLKIIRQFLKQKPILMKVFEEKCKVKLKWRQNYSFQAFLKKKQIEQKNEDQNEVQQQSNDLTKFSSLTMMNKYMISNYSQSQQKYLAEQKILNQIKLNQMMEQKLKQYQYLDLSNIPLNQQLIDKAIFKYKHKDNSEATLKYNNNSQRTGSISDLLNFGKLRGLNLQSIEKQYKCLNLKINDSEEKSQIIRSHRIGRSMSQYLIQKSLRKREKIQV